MAVVTFTAPETKVGKVDLEIAAKGVGTLYVSKGGLTGGRTVGSNGR